MSAFSDAYARLNEAQRRAVDTIDGPLLVVAGPGTGKTQLLSARVANILQKTDTPARNILCLTFTESGAANMRDRLARFIGQSAYDVSISTYHAFGGDLIQRYPEFLGESRLQAPVDDLGKRQILEAIVDDLRFDNPLKQTRHHIGDLMATISEVKRALLTGDDLRAIAADNLEFIRLASVSIAEAWEGIARVPTKYQQAEELFGRTFSLLEPFAGSAKPIKHFQPLAQLCIQELAQALASAADIQKSTPLTAWKNSWLVKDKTNHFVVAGSLENKRLHALATVLEAYERSLAERGLNDFDDMILKSIAALEENLELRYSLQERYLYVLLDEFQDTNAAQLRLVQLLTDNPVHEGRPNVMAVGDDDQAIYAFQGAQYSNMIEYFNMYRDTEIVYLQENYRSNQEILEAAYRISDQIEGRLSSFFGGLDKKLSAAGQNQAKTQIERRELASPVEERSWIAQRIRQLIDQGAQPSNIAVLAPKHKQLEPLVAYLNVLNIPVRYEKRENILDAPVIRQLIAMSRLAVALSDHNQALAHALWPEVLSYEFWSIPLEVIWELSWQLAEKRADGTQIDWNSAVLHHPDPAVQRAGKVLLGSALYVKTDGYEQVLDYLIGASPLPSRGADTVQSPLQDYYTSAAVQQADPELFYDTLSHLTILRSRLLEQQNQAESALLLSDFLQFIQLYQAAEQPMIDTSPYSQQADAVQLMTVFKAKGLEYDHVFLVECIDEVWGANSRGNSNKLTLPENLQPIRHAGATDDERLRILYVAITRARRGLYLTSAAQTFSGKKIQRLKYFDEYEDNDSVIRSHILPSEFASVQQVSTEKLTIEQLELDWRSRHMQHLGVADLKGLLSNRIANYRLSPTHLIKFLDLEYAGPQSFLFDVILGFPPAPSLDSQFGTVIHETLEWYQNQVCEHGYPPTMVAAIEHFGGRLKARKLPEQRAAIEFERGRMALTAYLTARASQFKPEDIAEKNFRREGAKLGPISLSGKIDRLEIHADKTISVIDYKTGKGSRTWRQDAKLHKYQLQLYAYKLLIEQSRAFKGYEVTEGRIEFVEPNDDGEIDVLTLKYDAEEQTRVAELISAVYKHVQEADFPVADYPATLAGIKQFEADLLSGLI